MRGESRGEGRGGGLGWVWRGLEKKVGNEDGREQGKILFLD